MNSTFIKNNSSLLKNRYELYKEVSFTPTSKIYKALDHYNNNYVAIKYIPIKNDEEYKKISKEIEIMNSMKTNYVVSYINSFKIKNAFYIVMEFLDTITLKEKMSKLNGMWNFEQIINIFLQILNAVEYIHEKKIVHNDLKPENIIYLRNGKIKIIDFGISKFNDEPNNYNKLVGTPKYLAPEIVKFKISNFKSDIYSLGVILYELITTVAPYDNKNKNVLAAMHLKKQFINPKEINENISNELQNIIDKSLKKNPDDRYQKVEQFKKDIVKLQSDFYKKNNQNKKININYRYVPKKTMIYIFLSFLVIVFVSMLTFFCCLFLLIN